MSPLFSTLYVDPEQTREIRLALQAAKNDTIPSIKALNNIALKAKNSLYYLDNNNELRLIIHTGQNKMPARQALYIMFKFDDSRRLFRLDHIESTPIWSQFYTNLITNELVKVLSPQQVQIYIEQGREYVCVANDSTENISTSVETAIADNEKTESTSDVIAIDIEIEVEQQENETEPACIMEETNEMEDTTDTYAMLDYKDEVDFEDTEADISLKKKRLELRKFIADNNEAMRAVLKTINFSSVVSTLDMSLRTAQSIVERNIVIEWHNYLTDNFCKKDPASSILINTGIIKSDSRPLLVLCEMENKLIRKVVLSPSLLQLSKHGLTAQQAINRKIDGQKLKNTFGFTVDTVDYDDMFWIQHIMQDRRSRLPEELQKAHRRVTDNIRYSIDYACQAEQMGIDYCKIIRYDTEKDANAIEIAIPLLYSGRKSDVIVVLRRAESSNFWKIITIENNLMAYLNLRAYNVYDMPLWFSY